MKIGIIAAVASNSVIGKDNKLLWKLPRDMKRFATLTKKSGVVVMGRKTHESIGRILPDRTNIVLSANKDYKSPYDPDGVLVVSSIASLKAMLKYFYQYTDTEIMIIGGEQLYREFLPDANTLYITNVNSPFDGDAYFPEVNELDWVRTVEQPYEADEKHRYGYTFEIWKRQ
jgi:dihydrofolate reductase